jgi:hypothetical protein
MNRPNLCRVNELFEVMRPAEIGKPNERAQGNPVERLSQYVLQLRAKLGKVGDTIRHEQDGYRFMNR